MEIFWTPKHFKKFGSIPSRSVPLYRPISTYRTNMKQMSFTFLRKILGCEKCLPKTQTLALPFVNRSFVNLCTYHGIEIEKGQKDINGYSERFRSLK